VLEENKKKELVCFLKDNFKENREDVLLERFENTEPIFLSDIYDVQDSFLKNDYQFNIYESAYIRLLMDFGNIKVRKNGEIFADFFLLYTLLNRGLFCISVDYIMGLTSAEIFQVSKDENLFIFLVKNEKDGNIKYIKDKIFKKGG
jgi:hypothetical protein